MTLLKLICQFSVGDFNHSNNLSLSGVVSAVSLKGEIHKCNKNNRINHFKKMFAYFLAAMTFHGCLSHVQGFSVFKGKILPVGHKN
jgi:hypothetical protein